MKTKLLALCGICVMTLIFSACARHTQPAAPAPAKPTTDAAKSVMDPQADKILKDMSACVLSLQTFSFNAQASLKVHANGRDQEMNSLHAVSAARPNQAAFVLKSGERAGTLVCDGKTLTLSIPERQSYVVSPAPATLQELSESHETLIALGPAASMVAAFLHTSPYETIMDGVTDLKYVGTEKLGDVECHHVKILQDSVDFDVWIAAGPRALMMKVVPDYAKMLAMPNTPKDLKIDATYTFDHWTANAPLPADAFTFTPPAGFKKAESLAQLTGQQEDQPSPLLGKPAPQVALDLADGGKMDLQSHKGKDIVVLDFWATWCGPCQMSLPILDAVAAAYKDKGVIVYALNQRETAAQVKEFMAAHKLNLTVALDVESKAGEAYGVEGIPTTVIIDKAGVVQSVDVGYDPNAKNTLSAKLDTLLSGKSLVPAPEEKPAPAAH